MQKTWKNYDYEKAFNDLLKDGEGIFEYRSRVAYVTRTYKAGSMIEAEIFPAFLDKKDFSRAKRSTASTDKQKKLNEKRAVKKLIRKINANFSKNDLWITLGYDNDHLPETLEQAKRDLKNYIRRIQELRKKLGIKEPLRYIYVTEFGEGRVHHHILISGDMDRDTLENMWTLCERKNSRRLKPDDFGLTGLAVYLSKDPQGKKRWGCSKGLKEPKVTDSFQRFTKKKVQKLVENQNLIEEEFKKQYPGYQYDPEYPCEIYYNEVIGLFYLHCRMYRRAS